MLQKVGISIIIDQLSATMKFPDVNNSLLICFINVEVKFINSGQLSLSKEKTRIDDSDVVGFFVNKNS